MTRQDFALLGPADGQGPYSALLPRDADKITYLHPQQGLVTIPVPAGTAGPNHALSGWAEDGGVVQVLTVDDGVVTLVGANGAAILDPARLPGQDGFRQPLDSPAAAELAGLVGGPGTWDDYDATYPAVRASVPPGSPFVATPDLDTIPAFRQLLGPLSAGLKARAAEARTYPYGSMAAPRPGTPAGDRRLAEIAERRALPVPMGPAPTTAAAASRAARGRSARTGSPGSASRPATTM